MPMADLLLAVSLLYVAFLFAIAFWADRRARQGRAKWLRSPLVYTLSISVYCTSWTFYGAVGSAARGGLEFATIYLGPTLVFVGWWWFLRKLVRVGRAHRVTSIADMISSRYGKSSSLAVLVTLIALIATTPYIALQLQSVTLSYQAITGSTDSTVTAFWIAAGLSLFAILFGTRNVDANERHHGVVTAIAVEAVVKLVALIGVGVFVVWGIAGGAGAVFENVPREVISGGREIFGPRWAALTFLSAVAIICLPRQFQVTVVENVDERHLATASWAFPLYLLGMSLFIMPIAVVGLSVLPEGANPDLFVVTLPLHDNRQALSLLAFLGGFSSATSMVIVAAIAISTMVSNHVVMPISLWFLPANWGVSGDVRQLLLNARRISIVGVLALGFLYYRLSGGSGALASIGLIAFVGVAQFAPSLVGGLFWKGATRAGALAGLGAGFVLWAYTLFLPSFGGHFLLSDAVLRDGPWGIAALRPQGLLGLAGEDPLIHALVWSLGVNTVVFLVVSVFSAARPLERLQAALFVDEFRTTGAETFDLVDRRAIPENLFVLAQRILGTGPARALFDELARGQGRDGLPLPTDAMIARVERELSGSVGAASAHAMIARIAGAQTVGMTELIDIASETQRLIETSRQLSEKSDELERAAAQLRAANERLRQLDAQKDAFLSQVSHELRTPMTSIRSFSEILLGAAEVSDDERRRFVTIVHDESLRLTRLLDEILDVSRLESGQVELPMAALDPDRSITAALDTVSALAMNLGVTVHRAPMPAPVSVRANEDRLRQVLINLLSNALKYNSAARPEVRIDPRATDGWLTVDVIDNGGGVGRDEALTVFEKFTRGTRSGASDGAGLGLPISRAVMRTMGGDLRVEFGQDGTSFFRLELPLAATGAQEPAAAG